MILAKLDRILSLTLLGLMSGALTACGPVKAPFNYETATKEEQTAFLEELAVPMEKKLKRALINPSGVGPKFKVTGHKTITSNRVIEFEIKVSGMYQVNAQFNEAKTNIMRAQCPQFAEGVFGRNNIVLRQKYITSKNATLATVVISNRTCRPYL